MNLIVEITSQDLRSYLESYESHKFKGKMTLCPFHDDHRESMSVDQKDGAWVWHCHSCSKGGNIIHYVMMKYNRSKKEAIDYLTNHFNLKNPMTKPRIVAEYPYLDEEGNELYQIVRLEPKDFRCRRKINGKDVWGLKGIRQVLYNLPEVLKHDTIWLLEGEKDCESLTKIGLAATTVPFGVRNWKPEFTEFFKEKTVFVCLDNGCEDEALRRARDIVKVAKEVKIIELPELDKDGQDITDWIQLHKDMDSKDLKETLVEIALTAPGFDPSNNKLTINNDFLNYYCESIARSTDAPYIFILFSGIALLSAILSKFYFYYPLETHLNLYMLLLAPSTFYRKTICLDIASDYMQEVNEELCLPESFTPEALFGILQSQNRGAIFWREFNQVKEFQLGKDYNKGLSELLTDVYDFKKLWKRKIKAEDLIVLRAPILSILAAGVTSWFTEKLRDIDFQGGLWTRFLFIPAEEEDRTYHWPSKMVLDPHILAKLRDMDSLEPGEVDLSNVKPDIIKWGMKHMERAQKMDSEIFRATYLRLEVTLLKLAALLQLSRNQSTTIEPDTFAEAVKIIDFLKDKLAIFFKEEIHFGQEAKNKATVIRYLKKKRNVKYRTLLQNVRVEARDLKKALWQLKEESLIKWEGNSIEWLG